MNFAEKLKKVRKNKKISQLELSEKIGITHNHYSRLETGKSQPSIVVLKNISLVLGVPADYLLSDEDGDIPEIRINNRSLLEKVQLIETLDDEDQKLITRMIDTLLTKAKMRSLLEEMAS